MPKRVTSYDVAKLAGVSQATVSYVFNDNTRQTISEETRQKVMDAARQLNYYSNSAARSLKHSRSGCISVVIGRQLAQPRYSETLQAVREELEHNEYRVLLCKNQPADNPPVFIRDFMEKRVDGIIYIGSDSEPLKQNDLNHVQKFQVPFVALDCHVRDPQIASIDIDYRFGMRSAVKQLRSLGCTKIIYIGPDSKTDQESDRADEFSQICRSYGLANEQITLRINKFLASETLGTACVKWLENQHDPLFNQDVYQMKIVLRREPDSTGIICSWRAMRDIVLVNLIKDRRSIPMVTLTEEPALTVYQGRLFHSALPSRETGTACARSVLSQIKDITSIRKEIIKPNEVEEVRVL